MNEVISIVLLGVTYKLVPICAGTYVVHLGYKLFEKGFTNNSGDFEVKSDNFKVMLKRASPGLVFAILGTLIIITTVVNDFSYSSSSSHNTNALELIDLPDEPPF